MAALSVLKNVVLRGRKQSIPSGYLLGRQSQGNGDIELISLASLIGHTVSRAGASQQTEYYFLGVQANGPFVSQQRVACGIAPAAVTFPSASAASSRSVAKAGVAPTSNASLILTDDYMSYWAYGTHVLCTVSFAAGSTTGTFAYGSSTLIAQGTVLYLVWPTTIDATLDYVDILFCGDKS